MQCFVSRARDVLWLVYGYRLAFDARAARRRSAACRRCACTRCRASTPSAATIPEPSSSMFQLTFAIITPALIIGGFAERMKFRRCWVHRRCGSLLVYLPVCHMVWGGRLDFATRRPRFRGRQSSCTVNAGVAALVRRSCSASARGFPAPPMPPHNLTLTVIGAGHAVGGLVRLQRGQRARRERRCGHGDARHAARRPPPARRRGWRSSGCASGSPPCSGFVTGMVAGLGTITPASGFVGPMGAVGIGLRRASCASLRRSS